METKPSETYESAVNGVREVRLLAQSGWGQLEDLKQKVDHVINTGIAHTAGKELPSGQYAGPVQTVLTDHRDEGPLRDHRPGQTSQHSRDKARARDMLHLWQDF